jgi:hypothetical protein
MSVYDAEVTKASCRVSGCPCHQRAPRYSSDISGLISEAAPGRPAGSSGKAYATS